MAMRIPPAAFSLATTVASASATRPRAHAPGDDDAHLGLGYVDALVEHLAGHHNGVFAGMEPLENLLPLARLGLVGDRRDQKTAGDLVNGCVVVGENQYPVASVALQ